VSSQDNNERLIFHIQCNKAWLSDNRLKMYSPFAELHSGIGSLNRSKYARKNVITSHSRLFVAGTEKDVFVLLDSATQFFKISRERCNETPLKLHAICLFATRSEMLFYRNTYVVLVTPHPSNINAALKTVTLFVFVFKHKTTTTFPNK